MWHWILIIVAALAAWLVIVAGICAFIRVGTRRSGPVDGWEHRR